MIFSFCRLPLFCVRGPGRVEENLAFVKAGQSDARASRAKPGSRHDDKISECGGTKLAGFVKLLFWGRRYRSGMRGGGMVARTRSSRKIWSCFEGAAWLWRRSWSCFEGAKLFWGEGVKFGHLGKLV